MQYRDVEMLNTSLERLGDSLLRDRVLREQTKQRDEDQAERTREFDEAQKTRRSEFDATQAHWKKLEDAAKLQTNLRATAAHSAALKDSMMILGQQVRDGQISNEQATQYFTSALSGLPPEFSQQFTNNPQFKVITDGKFDWKVVGAKQQGDFKTAPIANSEQLGKLREALVDAQASGDADAVAKATQALQDFQSLTKSKGEDDTETVTEEPMTDWEGKPITDEKGQQKVKQRVSYKRSRGAAAAPATADEVLPMPKSKDELKKGKQYQTSRGVATWDGSQFVR